MAGGAQPPAQAPPVLTTGPFTVGERVLVPHTDSKYYECCIMDAAKRHDRWHYFCHYTGWSSRYDEWIEEEGLVKITPPSGGGKRKKSAAGEDGGPPANIAAVVEVELPAALKKQLIEDYEAVVEDNKVAPLPRSPCVAELLSGYVQQALAKAAKCDVEEEVAAGLTSYFDRACVGRLLYMPEWPQAEALLSGGRLPSTVYGAEHLLRLFVKLPELLAQSSLPPTAAPFMQSVLSDVLRYIAANQSSLLLTPKDKYQPRGSSAGQAQQAQE